MAFNATPTEYKGVTYRSKSEAIFARFLDLTASELMEGMFLSAGFLYEPRGFERGKSSFDFLFWRCKLGEAIESERLFVPARVCAGYTLIEYKPKKPTRAYIENAKKRFNAIVRRLLSEGGPDSSFLMANVLVFSIYYGGPYVSESECGCLDYQFNEPDFEECGSWVTDYREDLLSYRYDLEPAS